MTNKEKLQQLVFNHSPIKGTLIPLQFQKDYGEVYDELMDDLDDLVMEGEIIEVTYLPQPSNHQVKSLYFHRTQEVKVFRP